jgi:hypothetical protein
VDAVECFASLKLVVSRNGMARQDAMANLDVQVFLLVMGTAVSLSEAQLCSSTIPSGTWPGNLQLRRRNMTMNLPLHALTPRLRSQPKNESVQLRIRWWRSMS